MSDRRRRKKNKQYIENPAEQKKEEPKEEQPKIEKNEIIEEHKEEEIDIKPEEALGLLMSRSKKDELS